MERSDNLIPCKGNRTLLLSVSRAFAYGPDVNVGLRSESIRLLSLGSLMFNKYFYAVIGFEFANKARVPALWFRVARIKEGTLTRVH